MHIDDYDPTRDFWGKLHPREQPTHWHPLSAHCIDVAGAAWALLDQPLLRRRLARLGGVDDLDEQQCQRLVVLAALHDLGKFNHGFQNKGPRPLGATAGHVTEGLTILFWRTMQRAVDLATVSAWAGSGNAAFALLRASISHHGGPVDHGDYTRDLRFWNADGGRDPLAAVAAFVERLRTECPLAYQPGGALLPSTSAFQHAFAGLVMLADWLGSDTRLFPYETSDTARCLQDARRVAVDGLQQMGFTNAPLHATLSATPLSVTTLFGFPEARGAQELTATAPLPTESGSLAILEAETGSGKTEAAWLWFARLLAAGRVDGLYFALPTRAAASQLHGRLDRYRARVAPSNPGVVRAVPGYLQIGDEIGRRLPGFQVAWDDDPDWPRHVRRWAAEDAKRFLAAGLAVGTIDQLLLSALKLKHSHLRATVALRSLLVVDEVHASDAYMGEVLKQVLRRHLQAGGHALLLSATLGASLRNALIGLVAPEPLGSRAQMSEVPYPLLTVASPEVPTWSASPQGPPPADKVVQMQAATEADDAEAIALRALAAAEGGGRVLVLRNTVGGAIAVQRALEARVGLDADLLFRCEGVATLHHGRFAAPDRKRLDEAVEARLGKDSPRRPCVLVATQTCEQSLDIDVDLLITDLAPVDVLLQRIGRLHRHDRTDRPDSLTTPRTVVLVPEEPLSRITARHEAKGPHGWGTVYGDLRVLQCTLDLVEDRSPWCIPSQNRALVEAATHPEALAALDTDSWGPHAQKVVGEYLADTRQARDAAVPWDQSFDQVKPFPRFAEERISTRLGEPNVRLELPQPVTSPFGQVLTELQIPAWMARGWKEETASVCLSKYPTVIQSGTRCYTYDRLGLSLSTPGA